MTTAADRQDEATATLAQVAGAERAKVVYSYELRRRLAAQHRRREDHPGQAGSGTLPRAAPAAPGWAAGGLRRDLVFNQPFADFGDLLNVGDLNKRLADLATVLIPAR